MSDQNAGYGDSVSDDTLLTQEQDGSTGEQQLDEYTAADASQENPSDNDNEAVVEKRLRDTQAKVTELAEQLKLAQAKLEMVNQPREEPFDETKFIDDFVGGEEAYNKYRDDPALLAKDLTAKMLRHQANILIERDKHWESKLNQAVNGLKTRDPEYAKYAEELKEFEDNFDLSGMTPEDKIKLAKMVQGKRGGGKTPPPGPAARKAAAPIRRTSAPAGYFEMLGLAGEGKLDNTLL